MTAHMSVEYFDEPLRGPFVKSLVLHMLVLAGAIGYVLFERPVAQMGDENAGGAVVSIAPVSTIPVPTRGPRNPLANDSKSTAPQAPPPEKAAPKAVPKQPEKAIPLKADAPVKSKEAPPPAPKYRPLEPEPNRLTQSGLQALSDDMYAISGAGRIGTGLKTTLGTRFGEYSARVRDKVAQAWRTNEVNTQGRQSPVAVVAFELLRNGTIRNVVLVQKSGSATLDASAQRAVYDAVPFPPLPREYESDVATVEFQFELKR